jgi:hypothetical protein
MSKTFFMPKFSLPNEGAVTNSGFDTYQYPKSIGCNLLLMLADMILLIYSH